jgi:hypothetical protein
MPNVLDLSTILGKLTQSIQGAVSGNVKAFSVDVFVDQSTFAGLKEANPAAFSEVDGEQALTITLGDNQLTVLPEGDDE